MSKPRVASSRQPSSHIPPALTLERATARYAGFVLGPVQAHVPRGARIALFGPSGAGKTTLLRMMAGHRAPDEGQVLHGGVVHRAGIAGRIMPRDVAYVASAERGLFQRLTVAQNVRSLGMLDGLSDLEAEARGRGMASALGIGHRWDAPVRTLSQGERQRAGLIRALLVPRPVLLLDEPTRSLDEATREAVWSAVHNVLAEDAALVVATHHQGEAALFARTRWTLEAGTLRTEVEHGA